MPNYDIVLKGDIVGQACVNKEGLYYHFRCKCRFSDKGFHRLWLFNSRGKTDLGLFVPENNLCVIDKKYPIHKIGDDWKFYVDETDIQQTESFAVEEDALMFDLSQLQNAYLLPLEEGIIIRIKG